MIGYLAGTIIAHTDSGILLLVSGLGYDVAGLRLQTNPVGQELAVYTHHYLTSDNQPTLIGFASLEARTLFRRLLKVPGIGPKSALSVIDSAPIDEVRSAILEGDITFFTRVKGLGKKAAQKIILELKHELVEEPGENTAIHQPIYQALLSLKFSRAEITQAIKQHNLEGLSENEQLRIVLQSLGK